MKTTSITLMKICVSALIMHFPIKEIASRAKNICCWNDFKVNIEHVRCQLGAIKYTVIQSKYTSQPSSINATEKKLLHVRWIRQKRKNASIRNKLEVP